MTGIRLWAWGDLDEAGKYAYINFFATRGLQMLGLATPPSLQTRMTESLRRWSDTHSLQSQGPARSRHAATRPSTPRLRIEDIPLAAKLPLDLSGLLNEWDELSEARKDYLAGQLAIEAVIRWSRSVPRELVEWTVRAGGSSLES